MLNKWRILYRLLKGASHVGFSDNGRKNWWWKIGGLSRRNEETGLPEKDKNVVVNILESQHEKNAHVVNSTDTFFFSPQKKQNEE